MENQSNTPNEIKPRGESPFSTCMKSARPTPETDKEQCDGWDGTQTLVTPEFARKLERERDEARMYAERFRNYIPSDTSVPLYIPWFRDTVYEPKDNSSLLVKDLFGLAAGKTYGETIRVDYGRLLAWLDMAYAMDLEIKTQSEIICRKCGLREERGEKPKCDF